MVTALVERPGNNDLYESFARFIKDTEEKIAMSIGRDKVLPFHIVILYRILLEREPDRPGLSAYEQYLKENPEIRLRDLAIIMMSSPEFIAKHPTKVSESVGSELVETSINGIDLLIPVRDAVYADSLNTGTYEPHVASTIRQSLKKGSTFVDLGSNVGVHSQLASEVVGDKGVVYAVDASVDNCAIHTKSLRRNKRSNVVVIPIALGFTKAIENITVDPRTSNKIVTSQNTEEGMSQKVLVVDLDRLLSDITRLDLIKIDVEGREYDVLRGASGIIERCKPRIIAEYLVTNFGRIGSIDTGFVQHLLDLGYKASTIELDGTLVHSDGSASSLQAAMSRHRDFSADHIDLLFEYRS